jgi:hypothetical protein
MRISSTMNDETEVLPTPAILNQSLQSRMTFPDLIAAIETDLRVRAKTLI